MRKINKEAASIFNKLVKLMNGENHARIDNTNGVFMPVHIERLQTNVNIAGREVDIYSVSHYYEQNGDLVPDPDMTFAVSRIDPMYIWPMSFQNALMYREGIFFSNDSKWAIRPSEQKDQAVFAGQWMKNIKEQQGI